MTYSTVITQPSVYRRSCRTVKRGYLTVRLSIDLRKPCELRQTLILTEVSQGLSHFHHSSGRDFAFVINIGVEPISLD
jgi:hypothetical protein